MTEKPNFYSVMPATVRYSKTVCANAKILFMEITALTNKEGYCWATNAYFADVFELSKDTISRCISELEKAGFIACEIDKEAGNQRRIWANLNADSSKKTDRAIGKKAATLAAKKPIAIGKKAEHNNIINSTSIIEREQHSKKSKKQTESVHAVSGKSVDSPVERKTPLQKQFIQTIDSSSLEEKKEERQTSMPAAPAAALPVNSDVSSDASSDASLNALPDFSQFKKYSTCEAMTADLKAYYRSNPNEWKVGVLQASKGARFTPEQLIDLMTAWATWMEETNKLYNSPRKMDLAFRRWVLNQQQVATTSQAKPQQAPGATTAQAKAKNFQFI